MRYSLHRKTERPKIARKSGFGQAAVRYLKPGKEEAGTWTALMPNNFVGSGQWSIYTFTIMKLAQRHYSEENAPMSSLVHTEALLLLQVTFYRFYLSKLEKKIKLTFQRQCFLLKGKFFQHRTSHMLASLLKPGCVHVCVCACMHLCTGECAYPWEGRVIWGMGNSGVRAHPNQGHTDLQLSRCLCSWEFENMKFKGRGRRCWDRSFYYRQKAYRGKLKHILRKQSSESQPCCGGAPRDREKTNTICLRAFYRTYGRNLDKDWVIYVDIG